MDAHTFATHAYAFLTALSLVMPRMLGAFIALPVFAREALPGGVRGCLATGLSLVAVPPLAMHLPPLSAGLLVLLAIKESLLGFALGYLMAIPFWAIEASAFFIDNQRGATIGATLDPLTGSDSSLLGQLFLQAFIVFTLASGAFLAMLAGIYESYTLWPVQAWLPAFPRWAALEWLSHLDKLVRYALLMGSPVIVCMFLAELGLAIVSRFVPQLQVFVLAMPIKSGLAFLVLGVYVATMFGDLGASLVPQWRADLAFLARAFGMSPLPEAAP